MNAVNLHELLPDDPEARNTCRKFYRQASKIVPANREGIRRLFIAWYQSYMDY